MVLVVVVTMEDHAGQLLKENRLKILTVHPIRGVLFLAVVEFLAH